jgi:hypothetical protein
MVLVFSGVAAYGFVTLAVMLIVRIVALWILLIFAPLAWVFGIMPFGQSASKQWWKEFWAWCFYGVTMAFFLYLACMAAWALDKAENWKNFQNINAGKIEGFDVPLLNNFTMLLQYMVVMVLIIVAIKFGKKGTSEATNIASGYIGKKMSQTFGKQGAGGWAWRKTGGAAWEGTKNQAGKYKDNLKNKFGAGIGKYGGRLPSGAGRVLARKGAKMQENARKSQEKRTGQAFDYSHLTEEEKIALVSKLRGRELEKMTQDLIKNNSVQKIDKTNPQQQEALNRMYEIARRPGNERMLNDFEARRLDMSLTDTQANIDFMTGSADPAVQARGNEAKERRRRLLERAISTGQLKDESTIKNLSEDQLADIILDPDAGKVLGRNFDDFSDATKETIIRNARASLNADHLGVAGNFSTEDADQGIATMAKKNVKIREFIAKNTGNYDAAFNVDTTGWAQPQIEKREKAIREAVGKINGEKEWEKIKLSDETNREMIIGNIQANQVGNAGRFLDSTKKAQIYNRLRERLEKNDPELSAEERERQINVYNTMRKNDLWSSEKFDEKKERKRLDNIDEAKDEALQEEIGKSWDKAIIEQERRERDAKRVVNVDDARTQADDEEMEWAIKQAYPEQERRRAEEDKKKAIEDQKQKEVNEEARRKAQDEREKETLRALKESIDIQNAERTRREQERQQEEVVKKGRAEAEAYKEEERRKRGQGDDRDIDMEQGEDGGWAPENNRGAGGGGGTTIQGGTINAESATINAQNVNIQTPEGINTTRGVDPLITTERPISPERPIILTPEPRIGDVRFSQGAGYTPQQRKDFEELRSRKYQESISKSSANNEENMSRDMRDEATAKAKAGNIDEAIKIAELIEEEKRQGYTLWEIASIQAEKGDFGGAIATARKIKDEGIKSSALHEIETMQDRKREE